MDERKRIEPQPGPQTQFLQSKADIAFYGGAAGGGKTFALLLECLRHYNNPAFDAQIFRRHTTEIVNPGGLWDEAKKLYEPLHGQPISSPRHIITFPTQMRVIFSHLEQESTLQGYHGAQLPFIGFDEVCQFTKKQFFYMLSRNRSAIAGLKPYVRGTCNPDPDSWVARFIDWWIDDDGFPIPERSGVIRWFIVNDNDEFVWSDKKHAKHAASFTFIPAKLTDNKILMQRDPDYEHKLMNLSYVDRMRLLEGNWKIRPAKGHYFKPHYFEIVDSIPPKTTCVRYWDRASSEDENADATAGCKMHKDPDGVIYIENVERLRGTPLKVERAIANCASLDGRQTIIGIEQDPGQAGVAEAQSYVRKLIGFNVKLIKVTKDKVTRASPLSAYAESGNVKLLRGAWNESFINELSAFPEGKHDDQVDAASGAFNLLNDNKTGIFSSEMTRHLKRTKTLVSEII